MEIEKIVGGAGTALEVAGVVAIVAGAVVTTALFLLELLRRAGGDAYAQYRRRLGRAILVGLELLVAGDIIRTVAVDRTFHSVGVLALLVLVRTFLSFSLELEIEGRLGARSRREGA